jgi:hypothetical protein
MYSNALPMAGSLLICSSKDTKNYKDCATSTKPKSTLLLNVSLELRYGDFRSGTLTATTRVGSDLRTWIPHDQHFK